MSLDGLPEELLIFILKQLDLNTIHSLYDTGNRRIQDVICTQGAVKKARLSLSSMATAQSLNLDFFKSISKNLQELDLSAIQDLSKSKLLPAMRKMSRLVTLNVGYTSITILDLLEIYEICSTIKNISITFQFYKPNAKINNFPICSKEKVNKCQDLFSNFENVHFIGSVDNLLCSQLPLQILQKAKLNTVIFTIGQDDNGSLALAYYKSVESIPLHCNKFTLRTSYWKEQFVFKRFHSLPDVIKDLPFEYEFVHIHDCTITISSTLDEYFRENYRYNRVYVKPHIADSLLSKSDHYIMIWNKETTSFDNSFYHELDLEIKPLQPCLVTYSEGMDPVVLSNDWVCVINPLLPVEKKKSHGVTGFKRKRVSSPNITLNYDKMLEDKKNVELSVCFYDHIQCPVTLSATAGFLKKLSFLQLRGAVRYSSEFFNILFRCCENLITLDVEGYPISPCAPPISRSVPLSRSLKNLRIKDKAIDLETLFSSLAQNSNLENIQIIDSSKVSNVVPSADALFKQCDNLYYLCICGSMSATAKTNKLTMLNKAKEKYMRHHLFIEIYDVRPEYSYDPFVDVFRLVVHESYVV